MTHLCFICTSTSNTNLSNCYSVAICHTATEGRQQGLTSTAEPPASTSGVVGQHNKIEDITFRAVLILEEMSRGCHSF